MSPKRKANTTSEARKKQARASEKNASDAPNSGNAHTERAIIAQEMTAVVIPKAQAPKKPISAVAARRALGGSSPAPAINVHSPQVPKDDNLQPGWIAFASDDETDQEEAKDIESSKQDEQADVQDISDDGLVMDREDAVGEDGIPLSIRATKRAKSDSTPRGFEIHPGSVSQFQPSESNTNCFEMDGDACLCIGLKAEESIVFVGQVLLLPLFGTISVMGAHLSAEEPVPKRIKQRETQTLDCYPVYSPKTHSAVVIEAISHTTTMTKAPITVSKPISYADILGKMADHLHEFTSVFIVREMEWANLDNLNSVIYKAGLLFTTGKRKKKVGTEPMSSVPFFQPILKEERGIKALTIPDHWEESIEQAISNEEENGCPSVSMVCGNKDTGKSTFARHLVNRYLNTHKQVAYLELDVGQSEFTPGGMIALHILDSPILGPPYTHQHLQPFRCHYLGTTSPKDDPAQYLESVKAILESWNEYVDQQEGPASIPLVANTQGWVKGLGYDLLVVVTRMLAPTDIFKLRVEQAYLNLPLSFFDAVSPPPDTLNARYPWIHELSCVPVTGTYASKYFASDIRSFCLMSYLHQNLENFGKLGQPWWNFEPLVSHVPWTIDWRQGLNGVWITHHDLPTSQLLYALNGSLVALTGDVMGEHEADGPNHDVDKTSNTLTLPKYYPSSFPSPRTTTCHGLAIIRAIDPSKHAFLVLTPLPPSRLAKVSGMVMGDIQLSKWCFVDENLGKSNGVAGIPWRQMPYVTTEKIEGIGGAPTRFRRNLVRVAQQ